VTRVLKSERGPARSPLLKCVEPERGGQGERKKKKRPDLHAFAPNPASREGKKKGKKGRMMGDLEKTPGQTVFCRGKEKVT